MMSDVRTKTKATDQSIYSFALWWNQILTVLTGLLQPYFDRSCESNHVSMHSAPIQCNLPNLACHNGTFTIRF